MIRIKESLAAIILYHAKYCSGKMTGHVCLENNITASDFIKISISYPARSVNKCIPIKKHRSGLSYPKRCCLIFQLNKERTLSCFAVICYQLLNTLTSCAQLSGKAVYAEKLIGVTADQLSVDRNIVCQQRSAAFLAGLVITHQSFTTFALKTAQS